MRVSLERGQRWAFATALDWPGWCRRGRGEEAALEGGGRDRDAIVDHVRGAERSLSCPKAGIRVPPRTPWDQQRAALAAALRSGAPGGKWPARYNIRRSAWHVLDHAWEIQDRSK